MSGHPQLLFFFFILCSSDPKELILFSGRLLRGVETTKALTSPPRSQAEVQRKLFPQLLGTLAFLLILDEAQI